MSLDLEFCLAQACLAEKKWWDLLCKAGAAVADDSDYAAANKLAAIADAHDDEAWFWFSCAYELEQNR